MYRATAHAEGGIRTMAGALERSRRRSSPDPPTRAPHDEAMQAMSIPNESGRAGSRLDPPDLVAGALEGVRATLAMSAVLAVAKVVRLMPAQPPVLIVEHLLPGLPRSVVQPLAWAAHLGYGAAAGAAYRVLAGRGGRTSGALFGLALWAGSYEGWVPVAGVLPPAHADDRGRVLSMVAGHLVYGSVLGGLRRRGSAPR
jgi:hypothetical protein